CHSLLLACSKLGVNMTVATPQKYAPSVEIVQEARKIAGETGAKIAITTNPEEAAEGADALYTDTFLSMGLEQELEERMRVFLPKYQVNSELLVKSKSDCVFMHCLPAHREYEVTGDVIDGVSSIVWKQVENRLHAQKSLLAAIF
ncbi:MAG: ornithine carbamoyltransferase, partial [Candidatus Bathyarchaeia archaeon]